jgi:hypothetical protein
MQIKTKKTKEEIAAQRILNLKKVPGAERSIGKSGRPTRINKEETALIAKCKMEGMSNSAIADGLGRHRNTIGQQLAAPEVRVFIEDETRRLMEEGLTPSRKTLVRLASEGQSKDQGMLRLALDASKTILGAAGITSQGSTTINNILNVTQNPDIAKELSQLSEFLASKMRPQIECIDVGI